jgi:hypothetical protein
MQGCISSKNERQLTLGIQGSMSLATELELASLGGEGALPLTGKTEVTGSPQVAAKAEIVESPATSPIEFELGPVSGIPLSLLGGSAEETVNADFEKFCREQTASEPKQVIVWWGPVVLPKSTTFVFSEADLYDAICESCRSMTNVVVDERTGRVLRTFCDSCRVVLSRHGYNRCQEASPECEKFRFVDEIGTVAPLCRGCHRFEQKQRAARRVASRRRPAQKRAPSKPKDAKVILVEQ